MVASLSQPMFGKFKHVRAKIMLKLAGELPKTYTKEYNLVRLFYQTRHSRYIFKHGSNSPLIDLLLFHFGHKTLFQNMDSQKFWWTTREVTRLSVGQPLYVCIIRILVVTNLTFYTKISIFISLRIFLIIARITPIFPSFSLLFLFVVCLS